MLTRERIEKFDASRGIPRKANEQYLPAYQAFWEWAGDIGKGFFFCILGLIGAFLSLAAGFFLDVTGLMWLVFWAMALLCLAAAFLDAYSLSWAYRIRLMSTSHGSASSDLVRIGLINRIRGLPIPRNALPLAKVFGGRDLFLPKEQWLRHFAVFGPTGSGKSKTFFITMIRAVLRRSSCLVYDPKGELCEQTGFSARRVFRLDLNNPSKSDRWNFVPKCRNDPAFACQVAGMMLGVENRRKTNADPFWGDAEQIALTAILLHIAEVYREKAIPAFAADFLLSLNDEENDAFGIAMKSSPSLYAKQAYLAFRQAPYQTRGSILIGLYNKLRPFTLAPARMVTAMPTPAEASQGCRVIDFDLLRKPGTAIYLVVSEGAADMYKDLISTFLGQAVMEMRLDGVNEPKYPCFVLIDEAYQLNVAEVKRVSGIGRMRDLLRFHEKRGGFPENLSQLEGVVWEKKLRLLASGNRALNHLNYFYLYTRISHHQFTLWAIPVGKSRDEAPTWFLLVTPENCRRWKGPALPLQQVGEIDSNPSLNGLGIVGLIEQPSVFLKSKAKISGFPAFSDTAVSIR